MAGAATLSDDDIGMISTMLAPVPETLAVMPACTVATYPQASF